MGPKNTDISPFSGKGLRVRTSRIKTSENSSEESNLPRRFRRYPEILQNPVKAISEKSSEISSANIFFFREVFRSFYPLRFYPLALSEFCTWPHGSKKEITAMVVSFDLALDTKRTMETRDGPAAQLSAPDATAPGGPFSIRLLQGHESSWHHCPTEQ